MTPNSHTSFRKTISFAILLLALVTLPASAREITTVIGTGAVGYLWKASDTAPHDDVEGLGTGQVGSNICRNWRPP